MSAVDVLHLTERHCIRRMLGHIPSGACQRSGARRSMALQGTAWLWLVLDRRLNHPGLYRSSTCVSAASACGSQNAMSIARYISMAVDSSARACCR
jgi:hypothetical protein